MSLWPQGVTSTCPRFGVRQSVAQSFVPLQLQPVDKSLISGTQAASSSHCGEHFDVSACSHNQLVTAKKYHSEFGQRIFLIVVGAAAASRRRRRILSATASRGVFGLTAP